MSKQVHTYQNLLIVLLCIGLLTSSILYMTKATTPDSGPYYLDVPTSTWNYLIDRFATNGSYYMVNGSDWQIDYQNTNATKVINYAMGNLTASRTWPETVYLHGNFTDLSGSIQIPEYTTFLFDGTLTKLANDNNSMIVNAVENYCRQITVDGLGLGIIDGRRSGQTAVADIIHVHGQAVDNLPVVIRNLNIRNAYGWAIYLYLVNSCTISNVRAQDSVLGGIYFTAGSSDNVVSDSTIGTDGAAGYCSIFISYSSSTNKIIGCYINGGYYGININGADHTVISGTVINDCSREGILINDGAGYATGTLISGCSIGRNGYSGSHYPNIQIEGHTNDTQVSGVVMWDDPAGHHSNYGIREVGSDVAYNSYSACSSFNAETAGIITTTGFADNLCYNGSGWISQQNAGFVVTCVNGSTVAHGLIGTPTSVTLALRGNLYINSTCWYFYPTVWSMNASHIVLGFFWNHAGTVEPVTTTLNQTVYWDAVYKP